MKTNSISGNNFGVVLMSPPQVNAPVPAIVRSIDKVQTASVSRFMPKFNRGLVIKGDNGLVGDTFVLHEAVVTDPKIRVVGLSSKKAKPDYPVSRLKGPGRKHMAHVWRQQ